MNDTTAQSIEILAPAGNFAVFEAALNAGADAVYLGLQQFSARRNAENFTPEDLQRAVKLAHERNVKIYLTLNIDLAQRELNQARRAVQLAADFGVDAILVRDPSFLGLIPLFPKLQFHFSTQAAISSSAGVKHARELGIKRVVLARELSEAEITACAAVPGIETEVFVQGAMCYSISGRCLMSSWVGGRSGNRGTCASPCRVAWGLAGETPECHPFSMHDLSLVPHVQRLAEIGVTSLKIEGRLKTEDWVAKAVRQFKDAAPESNPDLGRYTGREQTDGYWTAQRVNMVGESTGRAGGSCATSADETLAPKPAQKCYVQISTDEKNATLAHFSFAQRNENIRIPARPIKKSRGSTVASLLEECHAMFPETLGELHIDCTLEPDTELAVAGERQILTAFDRFLRICQKPPDTTLRYPLPENLQNWDVDLKPAPENNKALGTRPNRVRASLQNLPELVKTFPQITYIVPCDSCADIAQARAILPENARWVMATPSVIYDENILEIEQMLSLAEAQKIPVEINAWDVLGIAQNYKLVMEGGPDFAVLNASAAKQLHGLGLRSVYITQEADQVQMETLSAVASTPMSLIIFGRPPLFKTRLAPQPCFQVGNTLLDGRGIAIFARPNLNGWTYYPEQPFAWDKLVNPKIKVAHIVADLTQDPTPIATLHAIFAKKIASDLVFNYKHSLR